MTSFTDCPAVRHDFRAWVDGVDTVVHPDSIVRRCGPVGGLRMDLAFRYREPGGASEGGPDQLDGEGRFVVAATVDVRRDQTQELSMNAQFAERPDLVRDAHGRGPVRGDVVPE